MNDDHDNPLDGAALDLPEMYVVKIVPNDPVDHDFSYIHIVEPDKLDDETYETLKLLTSKSPVGTRIGKEAFWTMSDMPFEQAVDYLCSALGRVISTEDAKEGMMAFIEKREPNFRGR